MMPGEGERRPGSNGAGEPSSSAVYAESAATQIDSCGRTSCSCLLAASSSALFLFYFFLAVASFSAFFVAACSASAFFLAASSAS